MPSLGDLFPGENSPVGRHAGSYDPSTSRARLFFRIAVGIVIVLLLAWPFIEPFMLETESTFLTAQDLPAGIGQLRIVYVTDIHMSGPFGRSRVNSLISHINACNADIVLLGGDYATDSTGAIDFFRSLPRIHARYGVYAVLGNHDRTIPEANLTTLRAAMQAAGVTPLVNSVSRVRIGTQDIYIAGVDVPGNGRPDLQGVASQVNASDYVIFLCHTPSIIPEAMKAKDRNDRQGWFDLGLFGHTHGGQVAVIGPLLRDDGVPDHYTQGWFKQNRTDLLVSRGVGTSGLPVRLFCTPQIHLITVTAPK